MRQRKELESKITKLEKRAGLRGPEKIPSDVQTVYFYNYNPAKGETREQVDEKTRTKRADLVEKYGRGILSKLRFITFELVGADRFGSPKDLSDVNPKKKKTRRN